MLPQGRWVTIGLAAAIVLIAVGLVVYRMNGPLRTLPGDRQEGPQLRSLEEALDRYNDLVEAMQSDSIAALYTPDGELGGVGQTPVVGPVAIAAFLHRFDNYRILSESMTADSSAVSGDTGFQRGRYAQTVILPSGDTVRVRGNFTVDWVRNDEGQWRVRRMATAPAT